MALHQCEVCGRQFYRSEIRKFGSGGHLMYCPECGTYYKSTRKSNFISSRFLFIPFLLTQIIVYLLEHEYHIFSNIILYIYLICLLYVFIYYFFILPHLIKFKIIEIEDSDDNGKS